MKHKYEITGMTCNNCVAKVKSELLKHPDILGAEVTLNPPSATIEMQRHISTSELQETISKDGKYKITDDKSDISHHEMEAGTSWLETYKPLLIIAAFITVVSYITSRNDMHPIYSWMNNFMAGFFLVFSFFKLLNLKGFAESYAMYDLIAKRVPSYGYIYPFIELALGLAYLTQFSPVVTNTATIIVMGISSVGVIQSVLDKRKIQCACLGAVFNLPMSTITIIEDLVMVAMAVMALLIHP